MVLLLLLLPCSKRAGKWCRCRCCCCCAWKELGGGAAAVLKKSREVIELVVAAAAVVTHCARIGDIGCLPVVSWYLLFLSSTQPESSLTCTRPRSSHLDSTPPYLEGAVVMATRHCAYCLCCVRAIHASMPAVSACVPTVHAHARCSASAPVVSCDALVAVLLLVSLLTCCWLCI